MPIHITQYAVYRRNGLSMTLFQAIVATLFVLHGAGWLNSAESDSPHGPEDRLRVPTAEEGVILPSGKFVPHYRPPATASMDPAAALIVETGPGQYLIAGHLIVDRTASTITIPAVVNQTRNLVEYLLVSDYGKRHESILRTSVYPEHIHAACILIGLTSQPFPPTTDAGPQTVTMDIVWPKNGPAAHFTPEQMLVTHRTEDAVGTHPPLSRWIYNGSDTGPDGFAAQLEGSIIALIPDGSALVNVLGLPACDLDADDDVIPAIGTPVLVVLHFSSVSTGPSSTQDRALPDARP